ncbi:hypothetical protein XELAEV_18000767mg [Xenopus laevis]|nr:hypothetical protein XELAEV_18000767mg [Xenopus laevis]
MCKWNAFCQYSSPPFLTLLPISLLLISCSVYYISPSLLSLCLFAAPSLSFSSRYHQTSCLTAYTPFIHFTQIISPQAHAHSCLHLSLLSFPLSCAYSCVFLSFPSIPYLFLEFSKPLCLLTLCVILPCLKYYVLIFYMFF